MAGPDELEREAAAWRDRFHQAFHGNAAAMVIAHQSDLRIIDVNPRWLELFGATRDEVIGRTTVELGLISPANAAARIANHKQFAGGFDTELALLTRSGTPITVLASARPITLAEGPCTLTTLIDITARKQAEEAFSLMFQSSPAGMLLLRVETDTVVSVNERLLAMTQLTRDELVGRVLGDLAFVVSPSRELLVEQVSRAGHLDEVEIQLATKDGRGVWALASTETVTIHGAPHRLTVFTDNSARKSAETALRELNTDLERRVAERTEELESINRDLEAFTSTVSHDLRAPLRAIEGFSAILLEDYAAQLPDEAARLLKRINEGGGRLRSLIGDLLSFARAGTHDLRRATVDLDALVRSVVDELLASRELGDRLELTIGALGSCDADPTLLRTVWMNLVDNALKYSRDRPRIVIQIGRETRGAEVVYFIADNGVGFDPARADRLFGMFQRLHGDKEFEGTGIGLANVRKIIERHHGRVSGTSVLGEGSRFELTIGKR